MSAALPQAGVVIVCAGTFREAALEDILAAGMLVSRLPRCELTDSAQIALALYHQEQGSLRAALDRAQNGRALAKKGRAAEIDWCATASAIPLVAAMGADGFVRKLKS